MDTCGWFILLFYTSDMKYFSPINFTGSECVFGEFGYGVGMRKLKLLLHQAGGIIQPCFDEFALLLLRLYLWHDFDSLFTHLADGDLVRVSDDSSESDIVSCITNYDEFIRKAEEIPWELRDYWKCLADWRKSFVVWESFSETMEFVLRCIHFDTMINAPRMYNDFVMLVQSGLFLQVLKKRILDEVISQLRRMYNRESRQVVGV